MTPDLELERNESRATRTTTTTATTTSGPAQDPDPLMQKYRHVKANPRRRRMLYALIIFLAFAAVAAAVIDIFVLREADTKAEVEALTTSERVIEYAIYGSIALLFLWALFMLFSRRSGLEPWTETTVLTETVEQRAARLELERTLMQCPDCKSVFQFGEAHFRDNRRTAFSCPVCGVYSRLPDPGKEPVKVLRPEGDFKELQYHCTNCDEDMAVGTFGETPLHLVRFRACPSCGERGFIERTGSTPPMADGGDGAFAPA